MGCFLRQTSGGGDYTHTHTHTDMSELSCSCHSHMFLLDSREGSLTLGSLCACVGVCVCAQVALRSNENANVLFSLDLRCLAADNPFARPPLISTSHTHSSHRPPPPTPRDTPISPPHPTSLIHYGYINARYCRVLSVHSALLPSIPSVLPFVYKIPHALFVRYIPL